MVTIYWAIWTEMGLSILSLFNNFLFSFFIVSCEVTYKNNHHIYINIFFIRNKLHISCYLGVSRIFEQFCYFLIFK